MARAGIGTKQRILEAACTLFARHGFQDTTTQQICEAADANIAAVHYHFHSKEDLYREVWRHLGEEATRRWAERIDAQAPPEEQVRQLVRFRAEAILDEGPNGRFPRLIHREMSNPTPAHREVIDRHLRPKIEWFIGVVRSILGADTDVRTAHQVAFCIFGPLVHLLEMRSGPLQPTRAADHPRPDPAADPESLIETLTAFALGGLRELAHRQDNDRNPVSGQTS